MKQARALFIAYFIPPIIIIQEEGEDPGRTSPNSLNYGSSPKPFPDLTNHLSLILRFYP